VTIFLAVEFFPFDVVRRKVAVNAIAAAMGKIGFIVNKEGENSKLEQIPHFLLFVVGVKKD
jgi:hypothetical protein